MVGLAALLAAMLCSRLIINVTDNRLNLTADVATFLATAAGCWLLFPHLIIQERLFVAVAIAANLASVVRRVRVQPADFLSIANSVVIGLMGSSVMTALITNNTWLFRVVVLLQLLLVLQRFSQKRPS